jgi:hypothetical protein
MIPIKDKIYLIQYLDFKVPEASYYGHARFTGSVEEDSEETDLSKGFLYEFELLDVKKSLIKLALFGEEDILKKIK